MHFLRVMLGRESKVALTHVRYKGGSAALTDAIGGTLPAVITTTPNLLPMHRVGRLRIQTWPSLGLVAAAQPGRETRRRWIMHVDWSLVTKVTACSTDRLPTCHG
jgi:hypothetical protein